MAEEKNIYDGIRFVVNLLYRMAGAGIWAFMCILMFRFYILNLGLICFFFWLGLYLIFARNFVYDIKYKAERWSRFRKQLAIAAVRGPMTAMNLILIYVFFFENIRIPYLLWGCFLLAWSVIPVNMLIDYLEKKQCS